MLIFDDRKIKASVQVANENLLIQPLTSARQEKVAISWRLKGVSFCLTW